MNIQIKGSSRNLQAMLEETRRQVLPLATSTALNRAARSSITQARRGVSAETGIPQKAYSKRFYVKRRDKATARRARTVINVGEYPIPVWKLTPKPRELKSGVVKHKTIQGHPVDPRAFVARGRQAVTAFVRKEGASRLPIKQQTVDIGPILRRKLWMALGRHARETYEKELFHELDRRIENSLKRRGMQVSRR